MAEQTIKMQPFQEQLWNALERGDKLEVSPYRRGKSQLFYRSKQFAENCGIKTSEVISGNLKKEYYKVGDKTWLFCSRI